MSAIVRILLRGERWNVPFNEITQITQQQDNTNHGDISTLLTMTLQ